MAKEDITAAYQRNKQELEEQETVIAEFKRKGQQFSEDTFLQLRLNLQNTEDEINDLEAARRELSFLESEYLEELSKEEKKNRQQQDRIEADYILALQELNEAEEGVN